MWRGPLAHLILQSFKYQQICVLSGASSWPLSGGESRLAGSQAILKEVEKSRQPSGIRVLLYPSPSGLLKTPSVLGLTLHRNSGGWEVKQSWHQLLATERYTFPGILLATLWGHGACTPEGQMISALSCHFNEQHQGTFQL